MLHVLYEDNHLLVVDKPPGLPTMGVRPGTASVVSLAKGYIKRKYGKPGNVYLGVVSRLDAVTTGVLVLARTSKAARRLTEMFRSSTVEKHYWAVVERPPDPPAGECRDWLAKNEAAYRMEVTSRENPGAQLAELQYRTLCRLPKGVLVAVDLKTGRKHQIRVQFGARGWPILGDRKYGARRGFRRGIALHCRALELVHPVRKTKLRFEAHPPDHWDDLGSQWKKLLADGA